MIWKIFDGKGNHLTTIRGDDPEALIKNLEQYQVFAKGYQAYDQPIICTSCAREIDVSSWSDWQIHRAIIQPNSPDVNCQTYPCVCIF